MTDELKSNLEPIEEGDMDLKRKFLVGAPETAKIEKKTAPEVPVEKKEGMAEKDAAYSNILAKVRTQGPPPDPASVAGDAVRVGEEKDAESKINSLVNLAMQKGVIHAVKVAKHLEDSYALDEFHDRLLADELHDALVKKGLIKEI